MRRTGILAGPARPTRAAQIVQIWSLRDDPQRLTTGFPPTPPGAILLSFICCPLGGRRLANLVVRNLEDRIVQALKQRAAKHGRSAEAEHRAILEVRFGELHRGVTA